jgi:asparagine synthase (glutamine-hydrolysing)
MCGIAGVLGRAPEPVPALAERLAVMNDLLRHRGPDGQGSWQHERAHVGLTHRRLAIIDLVSGDQPMTDGKGNWLVFNGEIYNYRELRVELGLSRFKTTSDTEVILESYRTWGRDCVSHFRGMFSFALWDESACTLFCARDRFGIKPLYYCVIDGVFSFASEAKALLPFVPRIETDPEGLKDYLAFQFCLDGKTLFKGIRELPPAHVLTVRGGEPRVERYWEVYYHLDWDHTGRFFEDQLRQLLHDSVSMHVRADVPIGAYVSGGLDSGVVASLAARQECGPLEAFTGKFSEGPQYDESAYARILAEAADLDLHEIDITCQDFVDTIRDVIYCLDYPVAGPGSFPQYMVSRLAATRRKVVLGGQGGDEVFGGYVRYLAAYFEQCIKAAIDGTTGSGHFVVTYESIIPNLTALQSYKPMLQEFWREGLFADMDSRYFRLVNRTPDLGDEIRWESLSDYDPFETFRSIFNADNVGKQSYFDLMTHFDFKTLLPALLHVEDRVSMAHGLESRVPLLDHPIVELAATIPSNVKFENGEMKRVFKKAVKDWLPPAIVARTDKMGFPTPLVDWIRGGAREFVCDVLSTSSALDRDFVDNRRVVEGLGVEGAFGRKAWGLLCLELWQQEFHDRQAHFADLRRGMGTCGDRS